MLGEFCFAMIGRDDIEGSKCDIALRTRGCHKPVTPVVTFLTSFGGTELSARKDRCLALNIEIDWAFALLLYMRHPSSLILPWNTYVTVWQTYHHGENPRPARSPAKSRARAPFGGGGLKLARIPGRSPRWYHKCSALISSGITDISLRLRDFMPPVPLRSASENRLVSFFIGIK